MAISGVRSHSKSCDPRLYRKLAVALYQHATAQSRPVSPENQTFGHLRLLIVTSAFCNLPRLVSAVNGCGPTVMEVIQAYIRTF